MRRQRSAKIVATLGPASGTPSQIAALFTAGVDVFRLNFSHGERDEHAARIAAIRTLEHKVERPIGDHGRFAGAEIALGQIQPGQSRAKARPEIPPRSRQGGGRCDACAACLIPKFLRCSIAAPQILLNDGRVRLEVEKHGNNFADTNVVAGTELSDRKGVNMPGALLPLSAVTPKDRSDLAFALDHGADWIALSFVQGPDDVAEAKKLVAGRAGVLVKLEKPSAVQRLGEIVDLADAVMVARGDLGVEMPPEDVPPLQKEIVHICRQAGKPVVVATQMLELMVTHRCRRAQRRRTWQPRSTKAPTR